MLIARLFFVADPSTSRQRLPLTRVRDWGDRSSICLPADRVPLGRCLEFHAGVLGACKRRRRPLLCMMKGESRKVAAPPPPAVGNVAALDAYSTTQGRRLRICLLRHSMRPVT